MPVCSACGFLYADNEGVRVNERFWLCRYCLRDIVDRLLRDGWEGLERALVDEIVKGKR